MTLKQDLQAETVSPPRNKPKTTALTVFVIFVVLLLLALLFVGILPRLARNEELKSAQRDQEATVPLINAVVVHTASPQENLTLPANVQAIQEIPIYARTDGYLKERFVDIGDRVKKGQLLCEIETPELDKQLKQADFEKKQAESNLESAEADYRQSLANLANAQANVEKAKADLVFGRQEVVRYNELARQGAVSFEDKDSRVRDVNSYLATLNASEAALVAAQAQVNSARSKIDVARAAVNSQKANYARYESLVGFERVLAPTDGIITARNVDAGALITSGSGTGVTELLRMVRLDVLRVYVFVPQTDFQSITPGMPARIIVSEIPGREFKGKVSNVAGGLDPNSRTLQIEVRIDNKDEVLKPGMYVQVEFNITRATPPIVIPSNALVVKPDGNYLATVTADGHIHFTKVELGRDFGRTLEIRGGIADGSNVVVDAPDDLQEGMQVQTTIQQMNLTQTGGEPPKAPEPKHSASLAETAASSIPSAEPKGDSNNSPLPWWKKLWSAK